MFQKEGQFGATLRGDEYDTSNTATHEAAAIHNVLPTHLSSLYPFSSSPGGRVRERVCSVLWEEKSVGGAANGKEHYEIEMRIIYGATLSALSQILCSCSTAWRSDRGVLGLVFSVFSTVGADREL